MFKTPKLKEHSFLVYGLGITGNSVINFFKKKKISNFKVYDDNYKNLFKSYWTKNLNKTLKQVDYIILSPGISLIKNKNLQKYKKKIITDLDLFYLDREKFKSIVVTGTNGKSTTCKLLDNVLKKNKFKSLLGGNIGKPLLSLNKVNNSFVIIEASSFQLSHSKFICPDFALFLNFTNDHIDWHGDEESYRQSKFRVLKDASSLVFNHDVPEVKNYLDNKLSVRFGSRTTKKNSYSLLPKGDEILLTYNEKKIVGSSQLKLFGIHNYENILAALAVTLLLGLDESLVIDAVKRFEGLPHRMQLIASKGNVDYINDSKGTNVNAAIASINSVSAEVILLAGGQSKGGDFDYFAKATKNKIKLAVLFGEDSKLIGKQLKKYTSVIYKNTLEEAFHEANNLCTSGDTILLSPACASFDQFKSFSHRGDEFIRIVNRSIK